MLPISQSQRPADITFSEHPNPSPYASAVKDCGMYETLGKTLSQLTATSFQEYPRRLRKQVINLLKVWKKNLRDKHIPFFKAEMKRKKAKIEEISEKVMGLVMESEIGQRLLEIQEMTQKGDTAVVFMNEEGESGDVGEIV